MKTLPHVLKIPVALIVAVLFLAGCASTPEPREGAEAARQKLTELQADSQLASLAPVEIKTAELAVRAAEDPKSDAELAVHLAMIADNKVDIARAWAQSRYYEDQREQLKKQQDQVLLDARTGEADIARFETGKARADADSARYEADVARSQADAARADTRIARIQTQAAMDEAEHLQHEIAELNARETERGLVVTLGDVLFETNKFELKGASTSNLDKLAAFLKRYDERTVVIEGHTDSTGSEDYNLALSQRRADSVESYLVSRGVTADRLSAYGKGQLSPISSNETTLGRQQNRRVEVIISHLVSTR
jgi:outer membrane protein OmpA-like peptidoglycan-associated protein